MSGTPAKTISVLFIGNSYTFVNDLPGMLVKVASSDPANTTQIEVQSLTRGGASFKDWVADGSGLKMIKSRHWDYVVLQNQSEWALYPDGIKSANESAPILAKAIS